MAKLNITFVNEVGNNLNRYKAIDVNTGEEYLFDLSRNGTITTPGTPLNAEIMNAIVSAINEHFSNLVEAINDTTPSNTKYPSEKAVVDYVGQFANEESVNVSDNVLIKISGVSDNLAIPPESQMEVNSIEGNSVVVNQYRKAKTSSNAGITWTLTADGTLTFSGTSTAGNDWSMNFIEDVLPKGHKCLLWCSKKSEYLKYWMAWNGSNRLIVSESNGIFELNDDANDIGLSFKIPEGTVIPDNTIAATNIVIIDLTQWFGSNDNIPQDILNTPSNFFKYYKGSLEYDTGHIENGSGNLVDTNRNIWDEEWELGYWDNVNGNPGILNSEIRSKNPIKVFANTEYYFYGAKDGSAVLYFDINGNYINYHWFGSSSVFTTPSNCAFIKINLGGNYGTTYKHDICINVSDTNFNGTYVPHIKNTLDFGNDILRSAGNARDKKTPDGEITRKVGSVDLGTLDWLYVTSGKTRFNSSPIEDIVNTSGDTIVGNIICPIYLTGSPSEVYTGSAEIAIKNKTIWVYNTNYTDAAAFKAAMSGVILYYELETPTTEQGTPYDNYIPVYYGGQEFTTGDIPFVINKNYDISIKDQVLTNVKVDKEQSEQIHALEIADREQSNAINSLQNEVSNLGTTQEAHSTSINSLTTKVTDLENYKFDSSKLTIEQTLEKTTLKYNGTKISEIDSVDVSITPQIYIECTQIDASNYTEKITVINNTSYDMYVSMVGQGTHNSFIVPYGETESSTKTLSLGTGGIPATYTAEIEIKIYYNLKEKYNATTGYTLFENVKTINLRATVHTTDK